MADKGLLSSRGLAAVPFLVLPTMLGALWLALQPGTVPGRALVVVGTVAVAWYLLAVLIAGHRITDEIALRRQLRKIGQMVADMPGCAWVIDRHGDIRAQSPEAERTRDMTGRDAAALMTRHRASPAAAAAALLARVDDGRPVALPIDGGARLTASRIPGSTLQLWRIDAPEPPASPAPEVEVSPPPSGPDHDIWYHDLPIALLDLDNDGTVLAANRAAETLLGPITAGVHLGELVDGLGRPLADWIAEVREGRDTGRPEVLQSRRSEVEHDLQVTLAANSHSNRLVAVLNDVSALRILEAQFAQSQKMQAIGQLAGGIAHDFNNLLTAITGHCDLLMLRRDNADPDYADLHQISDNANRAAALVRQLLAFSRKQTLTPQIIDLRLALSDLSHLLNRLVGERIVVTVTDDPALRPIRADARQLEQVIINLVVNARDAMPGGGEIAIRTDNIRLPAGLSLGRVSIPRGEYVRITVSDQGAGMQPETLNKIFEPFFTTKKPGEGTGLGLSTAYGIVKQSGGYIFCDSTLGVGTTFSLYFPAQRPVEARLRTQDTPDDPALPRDRDDDQIDLTDARKRRVLLVEDEAPVRAFASRALKLHGFDVVEADRGERALELLADPSLEFDIFVTDVVMPGLDGPAWVRKALPEREGTRVIFMSGYTESALGTDGAPIPNAIFLSKPFTLSELVTSVENHLSGRCADARPTPVAPPLAPPLTTRGMAAPSA